jgi:hypothetical protein
LDVAIQWVAGKHRPSPTAGQGTPAAAPPIRPARPRRLPLPGGGGAGIATGYAAGRMNLGRLRAGEWIAGVSGVVLLASLFLPWYGGSEADVSAWEALGAIDVLLALVAAFGVLLAIVTAAQQVPAVPIALAALVLVIGLVGVILVLLRVADVPGDLAGRDWGLWLGLAGALGIVAGAAIAMRDERLPDAAPVEIEAMPAPRP